MCRGIFVREMFNVNNINHQSRVSVTGFSRVVTYFALQQSMVAQESNLNCVNESDSACVCTQSPVADSL